MTELINIKIYKKNRKFLKQHKKKLQKSSNVKIFINKEQLIIQKLSGMHDMDPMKSIIYIIKKYARKIYTKYLNTLGMAYAYERAY